MPYKSKRNRRPQTRREVSGAAGNDTLKSDATLSAQSAKITPEKISTTTGKMSKTTVVQAPVGTYFLSEVKWISMVTAVIVILLIVSYYLFK